MSVIASGGQARAVLARARTLAAVAGDVAATPEALQRRALAAFTAVRGELARRRLETIPIARLRETTEGRLRLAALEAAGYRTVADVLAASPQRLQQVPGVGPQTAAQAVGAARRLAATVEEDVPVRLDPDRREPSHTRLLTALWACDRAEECASPLRERIDGLDAALAPLLAEAAPAASRLRMLIGGRRRRTAAFDAAGRIERLLGASETQSLEASLREALVACGRSPPGPEALWRDYQERASDYQTLLAELGEAGLDVDAAQGYVPAEIAARVHSQQLDDAFLRVSLRGYQAFGAKFALVQRRCIIGDEMGLGKTIEAMAALAHLHAIGATHFLVVCPASVLVNWLQELQRRSALRPLRAHGAERAVALREWERRGGVAVTTFDSLRSLALPEAASIAMLVVDEAHYVKNPAAQRSQAVRAAMRLADRVLFLTGTPMENRVEEFRTLAGCLQPGVVAGVSGTDGVAGATAFRKAVAPVYLRRNQADVLAELPERLETADWVELGAADLAAYRAAVAARNFMAMRRAAYAPATAEGSAKLARLREIVEESAANGWKAVVFSYFRDVLTTVCAALGSRTLGPLTGAVAPAARQALVDEFTALDGHAVLVSQIQAGGVGLNIQAASVVILAEPQWKPSSEDQAIARCHRMGQVRRVRVHRLLATDSVDQRMLEILQRKAALFDAYARRSSLADASPDAVDVSDVQTTREVVSQSEAERHIIQAERERLGIDPAP